ncbi:MAG: GlxA family transcriptional regulator, partial [Halomonas sp.]|nr:GlxA family transcriptional regulator [Halomonas sp.]
MPEPLSPPRPTSPTRHVGVVVLPGFSLLAQACATEPLAVANRLEARILYRLTIFASVAGPVASASHQALMPQAGLG